MPRPRSLKQNLGLSFMGDTKGGKFDISEPTAVRMLLMPNPNRRPNSDVLVPWINGLDVTRRSRGMWIVDFGVASGAAHASEYELPFKHVESAVLPKRATNKRESYRDRWWLHVEPRPAMRAELGKLSRFIVTTTVSKHRISRGRVPQSYQTTN